MSKFNKQRPAQADAAVLEPGLVVATYGRHCLVESPDGSRLICHPRGKKSQTVVGDQVLWQATQDEGTIEKVQPRMAEAFVKGLEADVENQKAQFAADTKQLVAEDAKLEDASARVFEGKGLDAVTQTSARALDRFGTPELRKFLDESGLGNNPEVVKFTYKIGALTIQRLRRKAEAELPERIAAAVRVAIDIDHGFTPAERAWTCSRRLSPR